jgi:hypothetical protein
MTNTSVKPEGVITDAEFKAQLSTERANYLTVLTPQNASAAFCVIQDRNRSPTRPVRVVQQCLGGIPAVGRSHLFWQRVSIGIAHRIGSPVRDPVRISVFGKSSLSGAFETDRKAPFQSAWSSFPALGVARLRSASALYSPLSRTKAS